MSRHLERLRGPKKAVALGEIGGRITSGEGEEIVCDVLRFGRPKSVSVVVRARAVVLQTHLVLERQGLARRRVRRLLDHKDVFWIQSYANHFSLASVIMRGDS